MKTLSAYIAGALRRPLPPAVLEKTRHHLLDTLAAMLSGSRLPPGKKAISFAKALGGAKESCVGGRRIVTAGGQRRGGERHARARRRDRRFAFALADAPGLRDRCRGVRHGGTRARRRHRA